MIEVYVLLTLSALGYLFNKSNMTIDKKKNTVSRNELPSMNSIYDSTHADLTLSQTGKKAEDMYNLSGDPVKNRVINKNFPLLKENKATKDKNLVKSLTGNLVDKKDFTHNNMMPFFGGHIKQNMMDNTYDQKLERFTGTDSLHQPKCEIAPFADKSKQNIYGNQNADDYYKSRIEAPISRKNEFPVPSVIVGPGLNAGYNSKPTGGFQQDYREFELDKGVDELRVKTNPKVTYSGRVVDGQKGSTRGKIGEVSKNRVETYYEQSPDMLFTTTGACIKQTEQPQQYLKPENRSSTTREYIGSAIKQDAKARQLDSDVQPSGRNLLKNFEPGIADLSYTGNGSDYDYGKSKILVYNNERDLTTESVYQGNLTSAVKNIIAPILDMIKVTKKIHDVDNPRPFGNFGSQIPEKSTIYDPDDVARTTIKETNIHDASTGNLTGNKRATIYDPDDVARTTIKETNIHDTTTGYLTGPSQLYVYDSDDIAKTTGRETLDDTDYHTNLASHVSKQTVYDPDDIAKTTMKETIIDKEREYGNPDREKTGNYSDNYYAPMTQKAILSLYDHFGIAGHDNGSGYLTNKVSAPNTQRQFQTDQYFGAGDSKNKRESDQTQYKNARPDDRIEQLLYDRIPTAQGAKSTNNCVNIKTNKRNSDSINPRETNNRDRGISGLPIFDSESLTKNRKDTEEIANDRLDVTVLSSLKTNPYSKSII